MLTQSPELRNRFVRQRRNLIAISMVLLVAEVVGLTIERINLLGNSFELQNPESARIVLWVVFWYWLVRYYQYFRDIDNGIRDKLTGVLWHRLDRTAEKQHRRSRQRWKEEPIDRPVQFLWGQSGDHRFVDGAWQTTRDNSVRWVNDEGQSHGTSKRETVTVSKGRVRMERFFGGVYVVTQTHLATEYVLPFAIAAAPVTFYVVKKLAAA